MPPIMSKRAQGAIEYLLILGAAILVVSIAVVAVTGSLAGGKNTTTATQTEELSAMAKLRASGFNLNIIMLSGKTYQLTIPSSVTSSLQTIFTPAPANTVITNLSNNTTCTFDGTSWSGAGCLTNTTGLVGLWHLNSDANDASGNGNAGTAFGGASYASGKFGQGASFNGSSSYMQMNTLSLSAITVSAWINTSNTSQNAFIVEKEPVNAEWSLMLESGNVQWRSGYDAGWGDVVCGAPSNNAWHNIVATQTGQNAALYIDGVLCGSNVKASIPNGGGAIEFGRFNDGYYYNGLLDDVAIWNRALSSTEVSQIYSLGGPMTTTVFAQPIPIMVDLTSATTNLTTTNLPSTTTTTSIKFFKFDYTGSIVTWTVPAGVTSLTITAKGASGGYDGSSTPGKGASMSGDFGSAQGVTPGKVLSILVGQNPGNANDAGASFSSGGGGTFVALGANYATATPLIVAGGGGGASWGNTGVDAPITESGTGDAPGTNGQGAPSQECSGGGGGFYSSGGSDFDYSYPGGDGFQQGGAGGFNGDYSYQPGGFGGGGEADYVGSCNTVGGSGGGYSGGSATSDGRMKYNGEAGGSYNIGTNQSNSPGSNLGNGVVTISYVG